MFLAITAFAAVHQRVLSAPQTQSTTRKPQIRTTSLQRTIARVEHRALRSTRPCVMLNVVATPMVLLRGPHLRRYAAAVAGRTCATPCTTIQSPRRQVMVHMAKTVRVHSPAFPREHLVVAARADRLSLFAHAHGKHVDHARLQIARPSLLRVASAFLAAAHAR